MKKRILITLFIILIASQAAFTEYIESNESIFSKYIQPEELKFKDANLHYSDPVYYENYEYSNTEEDNTGIAASLNFTALNGLTGFTIHWFGEKFNFYTGYNSINYMADENIEIDERFRCDTEGGGLTRVDGGSDYYFSFYDTDYEEPLDIAVTFSLGSNFNLTQNFSLMYGLDFRFFKSRYIYGLLEYSNRYTFSSYKWIQADAPSTAISPQLGFNYICANIVNIFALLQFNSYNETVDGILGIGIFY